MNLLIETQQFAGNNPLAVGRAGLPIRIFHIDAVSAGTATKIILYNGTSAVAGNTYAQVDGTANKSVANDYLVGKRFPNGCFVSTDGNTAFVGVTFTEEF
jgi:hypothetical protein